MDLNSLISNMLGLPNDKRSDRIIWELKCQHRDKQFFEVN